jgi:hypothetical protein
VVKNWTQIDYDLDAKTRKQIEEVFNIENSTEYNLYKFLSESMDNFFKFAYLSTFLLYLCICLSILYNLTWLYIVSIILFVIACVL